MKPKRIEFSQEAKIVFDNISEGALFSKHDRMLYDSIREKINLIRQGHVLGQPVPKKLIPKYYIEKYDVTNLFRVELPIFWRMIYTLKAESLEIIAFVIEIFDHEKYNKRFGYKRK